MEAIQNPDHDRHEELLEWIGGDFGPEEFEPVAATNKMKKGLPDWWSMSDSHARCPAPDGAGHPVLLMTKRSILVNPETFNAVQPLLDKIAELADKQFVSEELRRLITEFGNLVGKRRSPL